MKIDVGDYPTSHQYMVYTSSENVPPSINAALTDPSVFDGMKVSQMLSKIVKILNKATAGSSQNPVDVDEDLMDIDGSDVGESDAQDQDEDLQSDEDEGWSPPPSQVAFPSKSQHIRQQVSSRPAPLRLNARIRADLRVVKQAGFRVGCLGGLINNATDSFVVVSCRVAKLGISDEALQAWHLDRRQYIVLMIHYTAGYRTLEHLTAEEVSSGRRTVELRVGVSNKYTITSTEAITAFSQIKNRKNITGSQGTSENPNSGNDGTLNTSGLQNLFIGRPLEDLLNDRLIALLRYRMALGVPWGGAEEYYNDNQGRNVNASDSMDSKYWAEDLSNLSTALPRLVTADHLAENLKEASFPLLAMQFTLRHLVRCTEFCLVCHCKVEADFEALKPYVCSKPLCLYQYMALGFGPSIEYEILSQPHVVDLLVSFCYSSASALRLKSLPIGMGLTVPPPSLTPERPSAAYYSGKPSWAPTGVDGVAPLKATHSTHLPQAVKKHTAKLDRRNLELIFATGEKPLRSGDWIIITIPGKAEERQHCRVIETLYPTVRLGPPIPKPSLTNADLLQHSPYGTGTAQGSQPFALTPATTPPPSTGSLPEVEFIVYNENFDDLRDDEKQATVCRLLDTLPSVKQMGDFLRNMQSRHISLRNWVDRISPAALGILRWIIASNRSCIVQVDSPDGDPAKSEDRVWGMKSYKQFRFAQGAPDKEQRFISSVRQANDRLGLKHPTLFAWHGSPLFNWHGIVREGLHFKEVAHGRAFGDGVYHSLQALTSLGYAGMYAPSHSNDGAFIGWPQSELKISSALSLNEIVNAPSEFRSQSPHLVVSQVDWIQTRYLFVRCGALGDAQASSDDIATKEPIEQDPKYRPQGAAGEILTIPITAVSKSRRPNSKSVKSGNKKAKIESTELGEEILFSEDTDIEDLEVFFSDREEDVQPMSERKSSGKGKEPATVDAKSLFDRSKTDFVPGSLDQSTLPMLEPPLYATSTASKALARELKSTLKTQETHPLHELGWYINPDLVTNVYQWIVELHSFDASLPLAKDMKARGLTGIVLEIRFGQTYPMSPPFVRVIRPRFLPFMSGGGGHVTAGGALCMELLTNSGWSAVSNIESVLLQVRMAISSTDPKPARLERSSTTDYSVGEAIDAYVRACNAHGVSLLWSFVTFIQLTNMQWAIPSDLAALRTGTTMTF